jgi:hypothetical protein
VNKEIFSLFTAGRRHALEIEKRAYMREKDILCEDSESDVLSRPSPK